MRDSEHITTVRALKTAAQAAIGAIGTGAIGLFQADWANVLSIAAMAAVISYLTSIAGLPEVDGGEPPSAAQHMGGE